MKCRPHKFTFALFAAVNVHLNGFDNSVVFGEIFCCAHEEKVGVWVSGRQRTSVDKAGRIFTTLLPQRNERPCVLLSPMPVVICLLRGINVGGHGKIKMDVLRKLCESAGAENPQTYIQSGNVVFNSKERNLKKLARKIEDAIEGKAGFRPAVILRTDSELADVLAKNPFAKRRDIHPGKLLITFLAEEPSASALKELEKIETDPEEMKVNSREVYIYFPDGMGRSKFPWPRVGKDRK